MTDNNKTMPDERAALVARLNHQGWHDAADLIESDGRKLARIEQAAHEIDCGTSEALQEELVTAIDAILAGEDDE